MRSSISSKKRTKTSRILVKTNSFVRFLEEIDDPKNHFEITWPLKHHTWVCFHIFKGKKNKVWLKLLNHLRYCCSDGPQRHTKSRLQFLKVSKMTSFDFLSLKKVRLSLHFNNCIKKLTSIKVRKLDFHYILTIALKSWPALKWENW